MTGFESATFGMLILMVFLVLPVIYWIRRARVGSNLYVRKIAGIAAIDEAIGRAAELGRPVSFCSGLTSISPVLYACLGVLHYIAQKAAVYRSKLFLPQTVPEVMAITEDVVREAYREEGRSAAFDPGSLLFLSEEQFAFAAGYIGLIQREKIGAAFLFGQYGAEALILAESGQQVGAMQIAATVSPEQVAFFICTCDYTLIGEELFAASAYLTREPVQLGSLYGQDRAKLTFLLLILAGVLVATYNSVAAVYFPGSEITNIDMLISKRFW